MFHLGADAYCVSLFLFSAPFFRLKRGPTTSTAYGLTIASEISLQPRRIEELFRKDPGRHAGITRRIVAGVVLGVIGDCYRWAKVG